MKHLKTLANIQPSSIRAFIIFDEMESYWVLQAAMLTIYCLQETIHLNGHASFNVYKKFYSYLI